MTLAHRLDLRQTQTLVMTPQLQQAIKLLQLSNLELSDYVDREIEQNPLLERDEHSRGGDEGEGGATSSYGESGLGESGFGGSLNGSEGSGDPLSLGREDGGGLERPTGGVRDTVDLTTAGTLPASGEAPLDTDYENVWTNGSAVDMANDGFDSQPFWETRGGGRTGFEDDEHSLEQTLSGTLSLRDHLEGQINVDLPDPADRLIALALMDHLDEAGYLRVDLEGLAEQLGAALAAVERVLAVLQRFDPPGIFARSLRECLALQLREANRLDPAMQAFLDHLELLAARNLAGLMKVCGVDAEDIADMAAEIRKLNPKPALSFDHTVTQLVTPDIMMRPQAGGGWIIDLNPDTLPRVLVNHRYFTRVTQEARNKDEKDYISERFHSANWLVKSLHQRATTILKVAGEIVRQQDAFFARGVQYLRPLILRDISEVIGMHESTVSRVTSNKYIATPRGVFELKYFFTASIASADGQAAHSAEAVRHRIKSLIDAETVDSVLSDDRLVDILKEEGIEIARRTVAKYRESMRIASSVQRRREKAMRL